jgi:hypothetical protein
MKMDKIIQETHYQEASLKTINRRQFFVRFAQLGAAVVVAPLAVRGLLTSTAEAEQKRPARPGAAPAVPAGGPAPMVDPNDATAKAVGYVEDHTKSPNAKGNQCATCGFYAKKDTRSGKEAGSCTIFAGKEVYAIAFCNSWNKKA